MNRHHASAVRFFEPGSETVLVRFERSLQVFPHNQAQKATPSLLSVSYGIIEEGLFISGLDRWGMFSLLMGKG
jgi:hypothetical protein